MKAKRQKRKPETVKVGNVLVRIYQRTRSINGKEYPAFEVEDYTAGKRRLRSFADHSKARGEAERIGRQLSTGEATAATMRNSEAASYGRALELLRPTGASLEVAAATYAKCFEILGGDRMIEAARFFQQHRADQVTPKTVADAVAELLMVKTAGKASERYLKDLRGRLERFAGDFAVDISSVTTADVQRWLDKLGLAPQSARNYRTVIGTLFSFAESRGYVFKGGNPVESVEAIKARGGTVEIYSPDEIAGLLKHASKELLPSLAIGAFAGLRTAELLRLDFKDIDLAGGFIHIGEEKSKTASRRIVPILPNLAQWLAPYANKAGKVWADSEIELSKLRTEAATAAGVKWKDNGLRHSFCSYRLAAVQSAAQVALEAGNSPGMVFKHYRELVKPEQAKAWFAVAPARPANVVSMGKAVA